MSQEIIHENPSRKALRVMKAVGLLNWNAVALGYPRWIRSTDVIDFAASILGRPGYSPTREEVLLAGGEDLEDREISEMIPKLVTEEDSEIASESWRLAFLIDVELNEADPEAWMDRVMMIYANFGYPEDMRNCSCYGPRVEGGPSPGQAVQSLIHTLGCDLGVETQVRRVFDQGPTNAIR